MANILKPVYGASSAFTVTALASLASDATLVAGWQSAVVDNTVNLSDDELITGLIKVGTSPTAATMIEVWVYAGLNDTPTYPDTITGSQGTATLVSANTKNSGLALAYTIIIDSTTGRIYPMRPLSVASLFGGSMPKRWGVFVVHNTGVALGTPQVLTRIPVQYQSVPASTSPPVLSNISPTSGVDTGGTPLTLTGSNFTGATVVNLNGSSVGAFTVASDTSITLTSPAHADGVVSFAVVGPGGTSGSVSYTYVAPHGQFAAYPGVGDTGPSAGLTTFQTNYNYMVSSIGQAPTMILCYIDQSATLPNWQFSVNFIISALQFEGVGTVIPLLGMPMAITGDVAATDFAAISAGSWDTYINDAFNRFKVAGFTKLYLRPGWEMNGTWYSWSVTSGNAAAYASAFQHIYTLAKAVTGMAITVVWNPNCGNPAADSLAVSTFYPGDSFVDVIGIDIYGLPLQTDSVPQFVSAGPYDFTFAFAAAMAASHGKKFAIPECGGTNAAFPNNLTTAVTTAGVQVDFVGLWNSNETGVTLQWTGLTATAAAYKNLITTVQL